MQIQKLIAIMLLVSITLVSAGQGMQGVNRYVRSRVNRSRSVRKNGREWLSFDDF